MTAPIGAVRAIAAAGLSLSGETMRSIGNDMHERYKETSLGGLALFVTAC
ncbi:L-serine deaminase [Loktanella ponticola]|uniref:L-serine deaminase n=1 Tax=Yoonia ponticola TaxID=1524255 RepID=A0A7W9BNJ8_9RHOB|nr:hypothetical protein [Yoonia ponticola]MBB5723690.1 L-serine deaminase [Yoonia ponticola]